MLRLRVSTADLLVPKPSPVELELLSNYEQQLLTSMTHSTSNGRGASRHLILRQLGHGNLTCIFLAMPRPAALLPARKALVPQPPRPRPSEASGELVVLKLLHPELAKDDDFRALFLERAATASSLRHPCLVRTRDVVAEPDACGVTLEFLQGETLGRVLERVGRQRFPVDLHLHILSKVLEALEYAHELAGRPGEPGFVHRDVCPNNVFVTHDGQIKLLGTGFGEALQALETRLARPLVDVKYAAPELLLGETSGPRSDLFGVGVMLWEALARQARVRSDDAKVIIRRRTSGREPELESVWPDAAQPLVELCSRALSVSPDGRYATARELRADLDAYLRRAAEMGGAVLGRLPELMGASFGAEREQMQRFIGARLEAAEAEAWAEPATDDNELAPLGDEWSPATSTPAPLRLRAEEDTERGDVLRTGLRRARPDLAMGQAAEGAGSRETGIHEKELGPSAAPLASMRPAHGRATRLLGAIAEPATPNPAPPRVASSIELPAPQESTTAGHPAYSSNLESAARARRGMLRLSPDVLGAAALLVGSLVATYSVYRHTQRDKKSGPDELALQAETSATEPAARVLRRDAHAAAAPALVVLSSPPDAGAVVEERSPAPAFFDGQATARVQRRIPASMRADELPAVDPELRSLQDAILIGAKAHRLALRHRRAKNAALRSSQASTEASPSDDPDSR